MQSAAHSQSRNTGLSHLFEAATALTKLVDVPSPEPSKEASCGKLRGSVVSDDDSQGATTKRAKSAASEASREIFPQRLMAILSDPSVSDVIAWLPHGRSFVIIRPDCLSDRVLSKYFASTDPRSSTKYPSFTRKLNRWGFRQATRGPDTGAFHHPLFRRDQPELCLDMVCQKSRKPRTIKLTEVRKTGALSSLPPKKRKIQDVKQAPGYTPESPHLNHRVVSDSSLSSNTVSGDDQSVSSASSSSSGAASVPSVSLLSSLASLLPPQVQAAATATGSPVVNNADLVAAALKAREEMERRAAAKAMLFDAYMKALNGQ